MRTWLFCYRRCLLWATPGQSVLNQRGMLKKGGVHIKLRADGHGCLPVELCQGRAADMCGSTDGGLSGSGKSHYRPAWYKLERCSHPTSIRTLKHSWSLLCMCTTVHSSPNTNLLLLIFQCECVLACVLSLFYQLTLCPVDNPVLGQRGRETNLIL